MKKQFVALALAVSAMGQPVFAGSSGVAGSPAIAGNPTVSNQPVITVHQDPNCGCCAGWAQHIRENGFEVREVLSRDMVSVKENHGVPMQLASCHTARVHGTGQVIEGHVPASAVRKMLLDPSVKGVAAPGMPVNSPGMGPMDGNLITVDFNGRPFSRD